MDRTLVDVRLTRQQIVVCWAAMDSPFSAWSERQIAQGFAWRPGSASFRLHQEDGLHHIQVTRVRGYQLMASDAVRVIEVPFLLPMVNGIEVGGVGDTRMIAWLPGSYLLRATFFDSPRLELTFLADAEPRFAIPVADPAITRLADFDLAAVAA
ncbi:competence protein ComJ [Luteibacter sp. RCC_6_2]|jgi:hypothetical protein|uniref:competence protein ComJ n=1 Tax=Luteibacter sp. RCC_6_2 TaxID=3239223 RepID=UPI003524B0C7